MLSSHLFDKVQFFSVDIGLFTACDVHSFTAWVVHAGSVALKLLSLVRLNNIFEVALIQGGC